MGVGVWAVVEANTAEPGINQGHIFLCTSSKLTYYFKQYVLDYYYLVYTTDDCDILKGC